MSSVPILPAVADAVRRYANYMRSDGRRRRRFSVGTMAPWEENAYFNTPAPSSLTVAGNTIVQALTRNPNRVYVLFANQSTGNQLIMGLNADIGTFGGFNIQSTTLPFQAYQYETGPLAASEWFVSNPAAGPQTLAIIELILRDWPM